MCLEEERIESPTVVQASHELEVSIQVIVKRKSIAAKISRTTENIVAKENYKLVAGSLDDILQCAYCDACAGVRPVIHTVVEEVISDLRPEHVWQTLYRHISTYFHSSQADHKGSAMIL